jgi:hypothetical protein
MNGYVRKSGFGITDNPDRFIICTTIFLIQRRQYRDMPDQTDRFGNISAESGFVGGDDYHLSEKSPCRDTGDEE